MMNNLNTIRKSDHAEFINNNKFVSKLSEQQKNDINMSLKQVKIKADEYVWKINSQPSCCFFIYSGEFLQFGPDEKSGGGYQLNKGQFVGDFPNIIEDRKCISSLKCEKAGHILMFDRDIFRDFLSKNPGLYIFLKDKIVVD